MELDGPASLNGATNGSNGGGDSKPSKSSGGSGRKYFVGDDGVVVWRDGMEVDTFMSDGVGELFLSLEPVVCFKRQIRLTVIPLSTTNQSRTPNQLLNYYIISYTSV